jgi:acetyl esterase/lipase
VTPSPAPPEIRVRSGLSMAILVRSLLGAVSVVLAVLPLLVAVGAFVPSIPTVGRFGALVVSNLPALLLEATLASSIAALALTLGGGRWTKILVVATSAPTVALLVVTVVTTVFASQLRVPFDLFHMARAAASPPTADEVIVYATVDGVDLHAAVWRARSAAAHDGDSPGIVFVHGGAFISGGLGSRPELFSDVAAAGIAVVDVEYRLASPPRWSDAPADVLCALGWVEAHAEELGIDPVKIVIAGESAGGNLAMLAGYAAGTDELTSSCGGVPTPPSGVYAVAPAADLAGIWSDFSINALDLPFPEAYVGGPPSEYPDRYEFASPLRLIRADIPPTFLLTGANDHFVMPSRVTSVAERIHAGGADCTLVVAPFADHGFDGFPNGYGNQLQRVLLPRFVAAVTERAP